MRGRQEGKKITGKETEEQRGEWGRARKRREEMAVVKATHGRNI